MRRPLPPDLLRLGDHLESAVEGALHRRRARRTAFLNGVATLAVAVPLALSVAAADLKPSGTEASVGAAAARPALGWTPGFNLAIAHIPEEYLPPAPPAPPCLDANDCRTPIPFVLQSPVGKV